MQVPHEKIKKYIESIGARYTENKQQIIEALAHTKGHFDVESFLDEVQKSQTTFSRATAYRMIKHLLNGGFIQKIISKDGQVLYEKSFSKTQHDHLICNNCGSILEIENHIVVNELNKTCDKLNFLPHYRSLHIYGLCEKCSQSNS